MKLEKRFRPQFSYFSALFAAFGFLLIYAPLVLLILGSFLPFGFTASQSGGWSLRWYRKLLAEPTIIDALWMSVVVGFWSTLGATFLGTAAAIALSRGQFVGKRVFSVLTYFPLVMPEIVLGLALLTWFVLLNLTLGVVSIVSAHITFSTSYVLLTVKTRLDGFDDSLLEAARDLGATPFQIFWKVTLPLIFPGILAGSLMAFTLSFDDFLITYFTAGAGSETLPIKIYSMIKFGITPEINALSTLMLLITLVTILALFGPLRKFQKDL
jgi:spermidine/putrescine transport system permease protein